MTQHPSSARTSVLTRLRHATTGRLTEQVTAQDLDPDGLCDGRAAEQTDRQADEFRALVAVKRHRYEAMTKAAQFYDPLQAEPQWLPARFAPWQFTLVGGSSAITCAVGVLAVIPIATTGSIMTAGIAGVAGALGLAINIATEKVEKAEDRRRKPEPRRTLLLPNAVGYAYDDYVGTVARLRAVDASEHVVAGIEAQIGFAAELFHEAARLHAAGASDSSEAVAVRDTMLDLAAHATALADTAEIHHRAVDAASVADPLLLGRAPNTDEFVALSHIISEETTAARTALTAATA